VYRHFPTKDDLIAALVAERFQRLAEKARECLEMRDACEGIADFIRFSAQIQADDRGLCELMGSRPEVHRRRGARGWVARGLRGLVKRAQRSGELRRDLAWEDTPMIARGLGRITQTTAGPATGRWPRLVENHPGRPAGTRVARRRETRRRGCSTLVLSEHRDRPRTRSRAREGSRSALAQGPKARLVRCPWAVAAVRGNAPGSVPSVGEWLLRERFATARAKSPGTGSVRGRRW
jgi:AcrR family transcriptional regulator